MPIALDNLQILIRRRGLFLLSDVCVALPATRFEEVLRVPL